MLKLHCLSSIAVSLFVAGCATASSTTRMLATQTQESRGMLSLEQANTRQLTSQRASLQGRLNDLNRRKGQLSSGGASSSNSAELQKINAEIAQLKQMIVEQ
jgi:peptidoglycan hydrolase CwlO-like protein